MKIRLESLWPLGVFLLLLLYAVSGRAQGPGQLVAIPEPVPITPEQCETISTIPPQLLCHGHIGGSVDRSWHVLVVTRGGTVSLLSGLTKKEAEFASKRLLGQPATPEEVAAAKKAQEERDAETARFVAERLKAQADACSKDKKSRDCLVYYGGGGGVSFVEGWSPEPGDIVRAEVFQ